MSLCIIADFICVLEHSSLNGVYQNSNLVGTCICSKVELEPGTKLYKWFAAFNGGELVEGTSIDPAAFIGLVVEVKLKNTTVDDVEYTNVTDVIKLIPDSEY